MMDLLVFMPNIHPIIVHFPIVLIPLGFVVHLVCVFLKRTDDFKIQIGIFYLAATVSSVGIFIWTTGGRYRFCVRPSEPCSIGPCGFGIVDIEYFYSSFPFIWAVVAV